MAVYTVCVIGMEVDFVVDGLSSARTAFIFSCADRRRGRLQSGHGNGTPSHHIKMILLSFLEDAR